MARRSSKARAVVGSPPMRHRGRSARHVRGTLAAVIGITGALVSGAANADDAASARARARDAYDRGALAHDRGDHATAARELALADSIVPSPVTLRAALESAMAADDAVIAIDLCDRSQRAKADAALATLVREARARFERRVGRVRVACAPDDRGAPCAVTIDGARAEIDRSILVRAGRHLVRVERDARVEERAIDVEAGGTASVVMATGSAAPAARAADEGPSILWLASAIGATAIAGGFTIGFGVDAANKHDRFASAGCAGPVHDDCSALAAGGRAAQLRTNVMIGVTSALGAASVIVGVVTLRARGAERAALIVGGAQIAALRVPLP